MAQLFFLVAFVLREASADFEPLAFASAVALAGAFAAFDFFATVPASRTLLAWIGASRCTRSPFGFCWLGFLWRQRRLTPSTTTRPTRGSACLISPVLPLSLPDSTRTTSPFLTCSRPTGRRGCVRMWAPVARRLFLACTADP